MQQLTVQLDMFCQLMPNGFKTIDMAVERYKSMYSETRYLLGEINTVLRFLLVVPASSAHAERSFLMLRYIKNHLRGSTMQARFNHICILHGHQERVDDLNANKLCKLFINNDYRRSVFGNAI